MPFIKTESDQSKIYEEVTKVNYYNKQWTYMTERILIDFNSVQAHLGRSHVC